MADLSSNGETILIVEDDTDLRNLTEISLANMGYKVSSAEDSASALSSAAMEPIVLNNCATSPLRPKNRTRNSSILIGSVGNLSNAARNSFRTAPILSFKDIVIFESILPVQQKSLDYVLLNRLKLYDLALIHFHSYRL